MKTLNKIFIGFFGAILVTESAFGINTQKSEKYCALHPDECQTSFFSSTTTWLGIGGGAAVAGGIVALIGMANSGGGGDGGAPGAPMTISFRAPTLATPDHLYLSQSSENISDKLNEIHNSDWYKQNEKHFDAIKLNYSLARGFDGSGSTIHIMDDFQHPNQYTGVIHGNAVSYIANQIAPGANIVNKDIATNLGEINYNAFANYLREQTTDKNIYNVSWETPDVFATQATTRSTITNITSNEFVSEMINAAQNKNAIFVFAAGNGGMNQSSALAAMPIAIQELQGHFVNVVAYDTQRQSLASYSNQCGITQDYCITAPGSKITTITPENPTAKSTGTSFAAPMVSGAIATLQQEYPYLEPQKITEILFRTADDLGETGVDSVYGWGMLNMDNATRPVGDIKVVSGNFMYKTRTATVTPQLAAAIKSSGATVAGFDEYGRPFMQKLSHIVKVQNHGRAFDHLQEDINQHHDIIEFGSNDNDDLLQATGFLHTSSTQNGFAATNQYFDIGKATISARAQVGVISARPDPESMINNFSNIFTASGYISAQYGDWTLKLAIPESIVSGSINMSLAQGKTPDGEIIFNNYDFSLVTQPAIEYAVSYKNLTAGFIDNPIGNNEFYVLAKTKLVF